MLRYLFIICLGLGAFNRADAQLQLLDKLQSPPCLERNFLVVPHIVRDTFGIEGASRPDIENAISILNLWFQPICVTFELQETVIVDNFQYDSPANSNELQQMWINHNAIGRINLYIVNSVAALTHKEVFATHNGVLEMDNGGILLTKRALVEEPLWIVQGFGWYCGLLPTNEDWGTELVNGSNCATAGDRICDTPADPFDPIDPLRGLDVDYNEQCRYIYTVTDPNGDYYMTQTGNAMSDYPTECWCGLTYGQFEHMATLIFNSPLW